MVNHKIGEHSPIFWIAEFLGCFCFWVGNQEVGNPSPILRLKIHKVGNRSPNDCVGVSRP
ncbi:MAG: hypothetical protein LBU34_17795 [Planctomycetaceae bacterium]|jgi:hypothetical protein|nr:hypothetical protein [Planctomycetaceae bacterium]